VGSTGAVIRDASGGFPTAISLMCWTQLWRKLQL
jgi:hypothetical protein